MRRTTQSHAGAPEGASVHAAARALHALLGVPATAGAPLEREDRNPEPPRLQGADALEPLAPPLDRAARLRQPGGGVRNRRA